MYRYRTTALPLHDAQLGANAPAFLVVFQSAVGEEQRGALILHVELPDRLHHLMSLGDPSAFDRFLQDQRVHIGEHRVMTKPRLLGALDEALRHVFDRLAWPVR